MYTNQKQTQDTKELRRVGGRWLKEKRESAGLSQRKLADILGVEYYTFISQIETGHGRIPPDRYEAWANAIGIPISEFVREILRYYDPITYAILFNGTSDSAANDAAFHISPAGHLQMQEQIRELQRLLGQKTMELELARERLLRLTRNTGNKSELTYTNNTSETSITKRNSTRSKKSACPLLLSYHSPLTKLAD